MSKIPAKRPPKKKKGCSVNGTNGKFYDFGSVKFRWERRRNVSQSARNLRRFCVIKNAYKFLNLSSDSHSKHTQHSSRGFSVISFVPHFLNPALSNSAFFQVIYHYVFDFAFLICNFSNFLCFFRKEHGRIRNFHSRIGVFR